MSDMLLYNPGFESPAQAVNGFTYLPVSTTWRYINGAGIAANGSPFIPASTPDGSQAGFIQTTGTIGQTFTGFSTNQRYTLSFQAIQRGGGLGGNTLDVKMGSQVLVSGLSAASDTVWTKYSYQYLASGTSVDLHVIGTNTLGGDRSCAIDQVVWSGTLNGPTYPTKKAGAAAGDVGHIKALSICGLSGPHGSSYGPGLRLNVAKSTTEGNSSAPSLAIMQPNYWRFRWGVRAGVRSITVLVKQSALDAGFRPSMVIKANSDVGLVADVTATSSGASGWQTLGPAAFTATASGVVWVELRNNDTGTYPANTAWFDHIVVA